MRNEFCDVRITFTLPNLQLVVTWPGDNGDQVACEEAITWLEDEHNMFEIRGKLQKVEIVDIGPRRCTHEKTSANEEFILCNGCGVFVGDPFVDEVQE